MREFLTRKSVSEKGVLWKRRLFRKVHCLEILEILETLEILAKPQTLKNKGEANHFLEILENLEILEILEMLRWKDPFRNDPLFRSWEKVTLGFRKSLLGLIFWVTLGQVPKLNFESPLSRFELLGAPGRSQDHNPETTPKPFNLDGPIRANRLILVNRFRVPKLNPSFCESHFGGLKSGKSKWGLSNGGLKPLPAICAQSPTIVHFCGTVGPFLRGTFVAKWRQS